MWPLLACSIVSMTTMILRGLALRRKDVMPAIVESEIEHLVPGESPERLSRIVHHDGSSLARITRVALQYLRAARSENIEAVQTRARHEMVRLERGLIVLEVIVGIARRVGHASDRPRHRRSIERHCIRTFHRGADTDRVHLFLSKSRSDVGGDGNVGRGVDQQTLLRPLHARI